MYTMSITITCHTEIFSYMCWSLRYDGTTTFYVHFYMHLLHHFSKYKNIRIYDSSITDMRFHRYSSIPSCGLICVTYTQTISIYIYIYIYIFNLGSGDSSICWKVKPHLHKYHFRPCLLHISNTAY